MEIVLSPRNKTTIVAKAIFDTLAFWGEASAETLEVEADEILSLNNIPTENANSMVKRAVALLREKGIKIGFDKDLQSYTLDDKFSVEVEGDEENE